jgi:hypothetical protein
MTEQEIFDKVWRHFIIEGNPRSVNEYARFCAYRGSKGAKCAFGLFIPDDKYDPAMEERSLQGDYFDDLLVELGLLEHKKLLKELQFAHDEGYDNLLMRKNFAIVANMFNLSISE